MSDAVERVAAACLFPGFAGLEAPDWILSRLERGLGGVVLFARNVRDREQTSALTRALRAERDDVLVAVDEEGGDVTRLEAASGSSYPGNHALGVVDDVALTEEVGAALGSDLAAVGINLDFAPVADVNSNPRNPIIGVRSFGDDPELVARHVTAFVKGMQQVGVAACAKHFPGHGDTEEDSHLGLPTVGGDRNELLAGPLVPFRAAVEAGVRSIMTAHIVVTGIDTAPATLSRELLTGMLRAELRFDGMVITDALEMAAIAANVGMEDGAVRALDAGADALCIGFESDDTLVARIQRAIVEAVQSGALAEERLRDAADRVAATGRWASNPTPQSATTREVGLEAARRALETEGDVALSRPPLVAELVPEPSIAAGKAGLSLGEVLAESEPATEVVRLTPGSAELPRPAERPLVISTRDAHRYEWQRATVEALLEAHPSAVVVELGLPYWRPRRVSAYVATHGAGRVNLEAAAEALLAGSRATT